MALIKNILENKIDNSSRIAEVQSQLSSHQAMMQTHQSGDRETQNRLTADFIDWIFANRLKVGVNVAPKTNGERDKLIATSKRCRKSLGSRFDHDDAFKRMKSHEAALQTQLDSLKSRHGVQQITTGGDIKSANPLYKKGMTWTGD